MSEIDNLIEHFEKEIEYINGVTGDKIVGQNLVEVLKVLKLVSPAFSIIQIKNLFAKFIHCLNTNILSPLTLNEGEFVYVKQGLSLNRRNPFIFMDLEGIYYEKGYSRVNVLCNNSFTGQTLQREIIDIDSIKDYNDDKRIYIIAGKYLTNIYFTKTYLRKEVINKHNYTPSATISLNLDIITNSDNSMYISCIRINNPSFRNLSSIYRLNIQEDKNQDLKQFGVTFNIKKDAIYSSERFTLCI